MKKVISFGEALIDFIPTVNGLPLSEVEQFKRAPGGAPANAAVAVAKLGGDSHFAGKVGADAFGEFLIQVLKDNGVHTEYLLTTREAKTALAFVSLRQDGERDFMFYREPSADMLIGPDELDPAWFVGAGVFHYGSITLTWPVSEAATLQGIRLAEEAGCLRSFDPNLRFSLWPSPEAARQKILPLLSSADLLKVGDEELEFLMETDNEAQAVKELLDRGITLVVVTKGSGGCSYYTPQLSGQVPVIPVQSVDTTGAGDAFVGGLLYRLAALDVDRTRIKDLAGNRQALEAALKFANACGAITTTGRGAIPSLPDLATVENFYTSRGG